MRCKTPLSSWCAAIVIFVLCSSSVTAFTGVSSSFVRSGSMSSRASSSSSSRTNSNVVLLRMSDNSSNQFDVSKDVFDPLSLRSVRGDAIIRYDSLNQSEPLRITLYGLLTLTLLAAPSLSTILGNEDVGLIGTIGSVAGSLAFGALFVRECKRRSNQLIRFEKELNAENLQLRLPKATNVYGDDTMPFTKPASLQVLRTLSNPPRIIAICGSTQQIQSSLKSLSIVGRRLQQASTFVVAIPTDGSSSSFRNQNNKNKNPGWLADPYDLPSWQSYFDELVIDNVDSDSTSDANKKFRWFGLNSNGRSFGSGIGDEPKWLEILGSFCRPAQLFDPSDGNAANVGGDDDDSVNNVLKAQQKFYNVLTSSSTETNGGNDVDNMKNIFSNVESNEVSEVVDAGGRIDSWSSCLADGARPEGMTISGSDAIIMSDTEAYSTVIEFPTNTGMDSMGTLLAIQQWKRSSSDDEWKLQLHQTIPWSPDIKAQGTLRCDCRGCVALTRGQERRTFGGLIG